MKRVHSISGYGLAIAPQGGDADDGDVAYERAGRDAAGGPGDPDRGDDHCNDMDSEPVCVTGSPYQEPVVEIGLRLHGGIYRHTCKQAGAPAHRTTSTPKKPQTMQYAASSWSGWCQLMAFHPVIQGVLCVLIGLLVSVAAPLLVYFLMLLF